MKQSSFKNSKFIDLTKYPLNELQKYMPFIINHIINNYDSYCDDTIDKSIIENLILNMLKTKENDNKNQTILIRKKTNFIFAKKI